MPSWFQRYRAKDWVTARTLDLGGVGRKCLKRCVRLADIIGCACDARQAYAGRMVQPAGLWSKCRQHYRGLDVRASRFHNYPPRHAMGPQSAHPHIQLLRFFALRCFAVSFRCVASNRVRMCGSAGRNRVRASTNCDAL